MRDVLEGGRCLAGFEASLDGFDRETLDRHDGTIYAIDRELHLAYVNPAWDRFAQRNGGQPGIADRWDLGVPILEAVSPELRPFYEQLYTVRFADGGSRPKRHDYECSGSAVFRWFHMEVLPLRADSGVLVVHSPVIERPHGDDHRPSAADPRCYVDADGMARQCAHCRRMRRAAQHTRWDWVPAWVDRAPVNTSHSLCPICLDYYYPSRAPYRPRPTDSSCIG